MELSVVARHRSDSKAGSCSTFLDSLLHASHSANSALLATWTPVQKASCVYGYGWISCTQLFAPSPHLTTLGCSYSLLPLSCPSANLMKKGTASLRLLFC